LLVTAALVFALGSIAHATHTHDPASASTAQHAHCGHCVTFGSLADAPRIGLAAPAQGLIVIERRSDDSLVVASAPRSFSKARAPPAA
jgi:hypothetical protein